MFQLFQPNVPTSTVDELKSSIDNQEKITIVDVRTDGEYKKGRIKNSIHVPVDNIIEQITNVAPDKNAKIFVYCLSGSRSAIAVDNMIKSGYTNVYSVAHGLLAWRAKKYEIEV